MARTGEDEPVIRNTVIVTPPENVVLGLGTAAIRDTIVQAAERQFSRPLSDEERLAFDRHVIIARTENLTIDSVFQALQAVGDRSAAHILCAALYREPSLRHDSGASGSGKIQRDGWVSHVVKLAKVAVEVAERVNCYILIDSGEEHPVTPIGTAELESVPNCGVFTIKTHTNDRELIATQSENWFAQVRRGAIGEAFASIDALPESMSAQRPFIKLQVVDKVLPGHEMMNSLRAEVNSSSSLMDASSCLLLARINMRAGDESTAAELLSRTVGDLLRQEELESALDLAADLQDAALVDATMARIRKLFPSSPKLFERQLATLMDARLYNELLSELRSDHAPIDQQLFAFYQTLAEGFQQQEPDYVRLIHAISSTAPNHANWARGICVRESVARNDFSSAFSLCLADDCMMTAGLARALLHGIQQVLLKSGSNASLSLVAATLVAPLAALIKFVAENPAALRLRRHLSDLLYPETTGRGGVPLVMSVVLNSPALVAEITTESSAASKLEYADIDLFAFLRVTLEWMEKESPLAVHLATLPTSLLPAAPDVVFANVKRLIHFEQDLRDNDTAHAFRSLVWIGLMLARLTSTPDADLDLIRFAAAKFTAANRLQTARDLIETVLASPNSGPKRLRMAWLAYADIYHRQRNIVECAVGLACMFSIEVSVSLDQMWQELYLLIRVLRDVRLFNEARSMLSYLRECAAKLPHSIEHMRKLHTLELGVDVLELTEEVPNASNGQILALADRVRAHCEELRAAGEELSPGLTLLHHCIYLATARGIKIPDRLLSTLEFVSDAASRPVLDMIALVNRPTPEGKELLSYLKTVETARYPGDVAFDLTNAAIAARRYLDLELSIESSPVAAAAVEVLSDQSVVASPGMAPQHADFEETHDRAKELSKLGLQIVLLALSEHGRLTRLTFFNGHLTEFVKESADVFSVRLLEAWSEQFPYHYGTIQDPVNLFYTSTDHLGLTLAGVERTVLVTDNTVGQIPPNLIRLGDEFAGRKLAISSAPSIAWLWGMNTAGEAVGTGRRAWIPADLGGEPTLSLRSLSERLSDCFDEHQIHVNNAIEVPDNFRNSELVVIGAHGGLLPGMRFFRSISDDGQLSMWYESLASAIRGSSLVVLFVCSAGRSDPHPYARTSTVGLVRELLRRGCSTVVACPWPLNVSVPPKWLPAFMEEWSSGKNVTDAVFLANQSISSWFSLSPAECLAMNVFGNPLLLARR